MISSLDDARKWYEGVRALANDMDRMGRKYWNEEPLAAVLALDNRFRFVESKTIDNRARTVLGDLDDMAVLLMFSVFEALVREQALIDVDRTLPRSLHPAVNSAVEDLRRDIRGGSFARVTDAFRAMNPDLIEEVDQVRRYRNWVAHGRRGERPDQVEPAKAYERLTRFLHRMQEVAEATEPPSADEPP
jgi:hypothetical protein